MQAKENQAYRLRLQATAQLLGKDPAAPKGDGEEGEEVVVQPKKKTSKPISREQVVELEYKALVSEGGTLYRRNEYHRAIDAFTKALDKQKDDPNILIDRANCYIQVGQPEDALRDVNEVLHTSPENPRAILTKAEAYFSMGEFEFALVFFNRGLSVRKDMVAFREGVAKSKSAICDSINGEQLFQPNPNFAESRPRKALVNVSPESMQPASVTEEQLNETAKLLPEKVLPLGTKASRDQASFLGELSLDYQYLCELREELNQVVEQQQQAADKKEDTNGKKEDQATKKEATKESTLAKEDIEISRIVNEGITYLTQRGSFWEQQGSSEAAKETKQRSPNGTQKKATMRSSQKKSTAAGERGKTGKSRAHYEMSKIEQYEAKYGSPQKESADEAATEEPTEDAPTSE